MVLTLLSLAQHYPLLIFAIAIVLLAPLADYFGETE